MNKRVLICFLILILNCGFSGVVFASTVPSSFGFEYYIQITIDADDVTETLTNFPVLIQLSGDCGANSFDATPIFDEIGNNYNYTAYALQNGTRLYFEVDYWNATEETAFIWIKLPIINADSDTNFYLWFERLQDGSAYNNASNVWNSEFITVQHLNDATTITVLDSTSNNHDGTKKAANEPQQTSAQVGNGQELDGADDYINFGNSANYNLSGLNSTIEIWFNMASSPTENYAWLFGRFGSSQGFVCYLINTSGLVVFEYRTDGGNNVYIQTTGKDYRDDSWHLLQITINDGTKTANMNVDNGNFDYTDAYTGNLIDRNDNLYFGSSGACWDGIGDEFRITTRTNTDTALNVNYLTQTDNLNSFGSITQYNYTIGALTFGVIGFVIALFAVILIITKK